MPDAGDMVLEMVPCGALTALKGAVYDAEDELEETEEERVPTGGLAAAGSR